MDLANFSRGVCSFRDLFHFSGCLDYACSYCDRCKCLQANSFAWSLRYDWNLIYSTDHISKIGDLDD